MTVTTSAVIMQRERDRGVWPQAVYLPSPVKKHGYRLGSLQNQLQSSFLEPCFPLSILFLCTNMHGPVEKCESKETGIYIKL